MRGDVEELRQRAAASTALAEELRDRAHAVRARLDVEWRSTRAESFRDDLRDLAHDLDAQAAEVDQAAAALRAHADEVEATLDAIEAAQRAFADQVARAAGLLAQGSEEIGQAAADAAGRVVDLARSAPGPGSLDWLTGRW